MPSFVLPAMPERLSESAFALFDSLRASHKLRRSARLFRSGLTAMACMLLATPALAQTAVSGAITANTRWVAAGSPYLLSGDVMLQNGAMLSIDPGVSVYMAANASLTVQAGGITAVGTELKPIQVLSEKTRLGLSAAPGDWKQWVFSAGTLNTRLEHVVFEHGKGLAVEGSAPVFNFLSLRNHQGAAISVDLSASPSGVGNQASGNTLNGIAVPAGDISGSVKWALRGIPYVLSSGVISVGASPSIQDVTPKTAEQGQTLTLTLNGARLDTLSAATSNKQGLALSVFSGGSASQKFLQLKVDAATPLGAAELRVQTDAGEIVLANALTITPPMPAITSIDPKTVLAGAGVSSITVTGRNFGASSSVLFNSAAVPTQFVSPTELRASLPNQTSLGTLLAQVRSPDPLTAGQYVVSNEVPLSVQAPVPPTLAIEPTPIALPPDSKPHEITVRLSKADYQNNVLNFSISDPSKASLTPASLTIPAGQTSAKLSIVPLANGTASLIMDSTTLQRVAVPLFITADFRGASTAFAAPVGVVVETVAVPATQQITLTPAAVGVSVGAVLTDVSPAAWTLGSSTTLSIAGVNIPANASVALLPDTGITLGAASVNAEANQLQITVTTAPDAPVGVRKLVLSAAGSPLVFADPAKEMVQVMAGLPSLASVAPIAVLRGSLIQLIVRGKNLQQGKVRILPDTGVQLDSMSQISANGEELVVSAQIAADALVGTRVIQVMTPAGATSTVGSEANTLLIATATNGAVTPIMSAPLGVMVGEDASVAVPVPRAAYSSLLGVVVGEGVTEVSPNSGVIGSDVTVTVRGSGLQNVTAVSFTPATGLSLQGAHAVNAAGNELTFTVRIAEDAPKNLRSLALMAGTSPLSFMRFADASFLVSALVPELQSVEPQVLLTGQSAVKVSVRGRNFSNIAGVRIEPASGITVSGPYEASADGTLLSFTASVAAGAASGERVVIVTSSAGDSSSSLQPGNLIRVASQLGQTYAGIVSAPVGVNVGTIAAPETRVDNPVVSAAVGVMVGTAASDSVDRAAFSSPVGLLVGAAAKDVSPSGWLRGAAGDITVNGWGLDAVASVVVEPASSLLLGSPVVSPDGKQLKLSIAVAPDALEVTRLVRLKRADGSELSFVDPGAARFGIGSLPQVSSLAPLSLEQGKGVLMTIRGSNLKGVIGLEFAQGAGISIVSGGIVWAQDALGEYLSVPVTVDGSAVLGNRTVRLQVFGGATTEEPSPANVIKVVAAQ